MMIHTPRIPQRNLHLHRAPPQVVRHHCPFLVTVIVCGQFFTRAAKVAHKRKMLTPIYAFFYSSLLVL